MNLSADMKCFAAPNDSLMQSQSGEQTRKVIEIHCFWMAVISAQVRLCLVENLIWFRIDVSKKADVSQSNFVFIKYIFNHLILDKLHHINSGLAHRFVTSQHSYPNRSPRIVLLKLQPMSCSFYSPLSLFNLLPTWRIHCMQSILQHFHISKPQTQLMICLSYFFKNFLKQLFPQFQYINNYFSTFLSPSPPQH